jgi:hypothetical protein
VNDDRIDFPNFSIDTNTYEVKPQYNNLFVEDDVSYVYATVKDGVDDLEQYYHLFNQTHPSAVALITGISHLVHQIAGRLAHGHEFRPNHLLFPSAYPEGHMWEISFRQLCSLFSRSMIGVELVQGASVKTQLNKYETLGDLPLFARARGRNKHLEKWLDGKDLPLIVLTDPEASMSLGNMHNTSTLLYGLQAFSEERPCRLEPRVMNDLRYSLPSLLASCLKAVTPTDEELDDVVPARVGYRWICTMLGLEPKDAVFNMLERYPPADWVDYVDAFFIALNKILKDKKMDSVEISTSQEACREHQNSLGWKDTDGVWLMGGRALKRINEFMDHSLTLAKLERIMTERGVVTESRRKRGFPVALFIPADEWDRRVDRRIRELRAEAIVPVFKIA